MLDLIRSWIYVLFICTARDATNKHGEVDDVENVCDECQDRFKPLGIRRGSLLTLLHITEASASQQRTNIF
ncbi:hypothetical protein ACHQM5_008426 [Ranunculus cassubicifolius]